jgi:hypothetical protein
MGTFRAKLATIVAVCVLPALAAALLRAREARLELVEEVKARLDSVDESFASDLTDDLASQGVALRLAATDPRVVDALARDGHAEAPEAARVLSSVYPEADVILVAMDGSVLAATRPERVPRSLSIGSLPALAAVWRNERYVGLLPFGEGERACDAGATSVALARRSVGISVAPVMGRRSTRLY